MAITPEQVDYVAGLSRLNLTSEEKKRFSVQLDGILEYIEKLEELDTEGVEPLVHMADRNNVFKEDRREESLSRREALQNAPEQTEGCFKVPSIIE